MKTLFSIAVPLLLISWNNVQAQSVRSYETNPDRLRTNQWIFGQDNSLKFFPNNQADTFKVNSSGSSSVFSTERGRVVLYTNGETIWDSMNQVVVSGLKGSSTIKGTVFYHHAQDSTVTLFNSSMTYTKLKLTYNGIIVLEKNIPIGAETYTHTLALLNAKDCKNAWFVSSYNIDDKYYLNSFPIIDGEISNCPVVSYLGSFSTYHMDLTFSVSGKYLLITQMASPSVRPAIVLEFNTENGKAKRLFLIPIIRSVGGAAISPDSRTIYIHESNRPMKVVSFFPNDSQSTVQSIKLEGIKSGLFKFQNSILGDIIFSSSDSNHLASIKSPNDFDNYIVQTKGVATRTNTPTFGLPLFNHSYFHTPSIDFAYDYDCITNSISFKGRDTFYADSHYWSIRKNGKPLEASYSLKSPKHEFKDTGLYQIIYIASLDNRKDTVTKSITIYPKIRTDFLGRDTSYETGISFSRILSAPTGMHCYFWYNDSSRSNEFTTDSSGVFICRMSSRSFCEVTDTIVITRCINDMAIPIIQRSGNILHVIHQNADSFVWYRNDELYKSTKVPFLHVKDTGSFMVVAMKKGHCNKSSNYQIVHELEIHSLGILQDYISFFPNPASDLLSIVFEKSDIYEIKILNPIGQVVLKLNSESNVNIDMDKLPNGVYFLQIVNSGNQQFITKIIKD